jgi:23S rRNA (guanosine2251-2'-O)-methyltransferase
MKSLKVRNKNAILELLKSGLRFEKIVLVKNLKQDDLTKEIVHIAHKNKVPVESADIQKMSKRRGGQTREVIVGFLLPENLTTIKDLLKDLYGREEDPFFLLINRVDFENNIGVIARTAFAAGVNGLIFQGKEEDFLNEETLHFSVGAIARLPIVKMNIFEALKELNKNGIRLFCLQMSGDTYHQEDLSGPVAFVLGAEAKGISEQIETRCDKSISIPMRNGIDSLNVGVSAGIILYEKMRQDNHGSV